MQIIVKITTLIALGIILNGCGKSEPLAELEEPSVIVAPTIDAPMLDGEGLGDMVVEIYNEHQRLTIELLKRYNQYKKTSDFHNYTLWRHEHWQPQYDKKNAYYAAVLDKNRANVMKFNLFPFFIGFSNLSLQANAVYGALKREDYSYIEQFKERGAEDHLLMKEIIDKLKPENQTED